MIIPKSIISSFYLMARKEAMQIEELKQYLPDYLESIGVDTRKASRSNTVCPICDGGHKTGCFHFYPDTMKVMCYSGNCGFQGDLFDLIAAKEHISNKEAIQRANEMYNNNQQKSTKYPRMRIQHQPELVDQTDFFLQAASNNDYKYLESRGISKEIQQKFNIGYDEAWKHPNISNNPNVPTSPRCIIPINAYSYTARDTRDNLTPEQSKYKKMKYGKSGLFNSEVIRDIDIIFITEGEVDAMSIEQAGGAAIGLGSTTNSGKLVELIKNNKENKAIILMLDNDEAGKTAQNQLKESLEALEIPVIEADYQGKDPNEALINDPKSFRELISSLQDKAEVAEPKTNEYNALEQLEYFKTIENQPKGFEVSTGFKELDNVLYGGLHAGLYIAGAVSSLGKTTFCLQLADQIAGQGQDVLFFSLEMSKYELIAKSISRHTYMKEGNNQKDGHYIARDTQQVINNRRYKYYTDEEKQAIKQAIEDYSKEAKHLFIYEGRYQGERLKVSNIREIVKSHIEKTGHKPVIFIDYLQIIAPGDPHTTDKQATDANVFELKEISRDYDIPVFAISSFNRDNYQEPVNMASFKESGAVEYSSDILIGLQYAGMDYQENDSDKKRKDRIKELMNDIRNKQKNREPINIELKILKNRNGYKDSITYNMVAAYNYFSEEMGKAAYQKYIKTI